MPGYGARQPSRYMIVVIPNPLFNNLFCGSCSSPVPVHNRRDFSRRITQPTFPTSVANLRDILEHTIREAILFQVLDNVFHWIQFWTVRWQNQESYVFGDLKLFTFVPASTVENQNAVVFWLYRSTGEMFVHGCCVGVANCEHPFCTCGSEKVDVTVAVVASDPRAAVLARPQPCQHSLLANSTFVLEPGRSPGLVVPYRIFVLKILTEFLLGLCLKRTRRNVTEAQPLPDVFLPWNT